MKKYIQAISFILLASAIATQVCIFCVVVGDVGVEYCRLLRFSGSAFKASLSYMLALVCLPLKVAGFVVPFLMPGIVAQSDGEWDCQMLALIIGSLASIILMPLCGLIKGKFFDFTCIGGMLLAIELLLGLILWICHKYRDRL